MPMLKHRLEQLAKFKAFDPEAILQAAKDDKDNKYPYITAFVKLAWEWPSIVRELEYAMESVKELDALQWAAEKVLNEERIDSPDDKVSVWEGVLYPGAEVIKDLRKRGWSDDRIRKHKITDLEIQHERHLTPDDFCINCQDPDEYVGPDKLLCTLCEDELEYLHEYKPTVERGHSPAPDSGAEAQQGVV